MSDGTKIEWSDATWPVVAGCYKVSAGCRGCYAIRDSWRLSHHPNPKVSGVYTGTVAKTEGGKLNWTGLVRTVPQRLDWPLNWRKPRMIFVCNEADLFHPDVPDEYIRRVWKIMAKSPAHTFQVLTKRPDRMAAWVYENVSGPAEFGDWTLTAAGGFPLPGVWLGTSVEDQAAADERIPHLLRTPAAVRFLSCEPLLGPIDLARAAGVTYWDDPSAGIHWCIAGSESGPGRRECNIDWVRSLRDQCREAAIPFFLKQLHVGGRKAGTPELDGRRWTEFPNGRRQERRQG